MLKEHACWFAAPYNTTCAPLTAANLRSLLGDFGSLTW